MKQILAHDAAARSSSSAGRAVGLNVRVAAQLGSAATYDPY
jgi:hypothetical protein